MKKKVVHIITKLELGGAQQNTLYTVENLNKEKFEVYLLCGKGGILDDKAKEITKAKKVKTFFITHLIREINPINDFLAFIELFIFLQKIKPEVVHTHSSKAGILGRWASFFYKLFSLKKNLKIIHTFHGFGFSRFHKLPLRVAFIIIEFFTAIITDWLIFVSNDNIKTARKYKIGYIKKYLLIRSGIKISEFYNISNNKEIKTQKKKELGIQEEIVITTIGPFKPQKNLKDFIKLADIILKKLPDKKVKFLIAGDGQQREFLQSMCKKLKLENKIKFLSWYKDIKGLFSITDIFVLTSLWEGLPRSAVESLVSGVPVVAYAVDGLNDIVKNDINGYLVEPRNLEKLAEKILLLLTDKEKFVKIKNTTIKTIDKSFDIDYMVLRQENLYYLG